MADYPTKSYYSVIGNQKNIAVVYRVNNLNMTFELYKYSMALVNVFYSDISYNYISESPTLT